jgi:ATP-binding cassette subfamily F protein uup
VEYAGGYTDLLAQRGSTRFVKRAGDTRAAAEKATREPAFGGEASAAKAPAKKLSFKQKFALESLPRKMEEANATIVKLEATLADPQLFARDPKGFGKTAEKLDKERAALSAMEEEWLELEMLREEIEGG